jgi:hypothetical protein
LRVTPQRQCSSFRNDTSILSHCEQPSVLLGSEAISSPHIK